ncbi:FadR/GntR family transcriptional regulator [Roseinatronobacter sp. S2]|uniref:FadR/GntR family transcriptional regulator n=1 Tax=Roseinatronobacter sp. S2 TaxID=3035471 RepID=UPI00240FCB3E|nr:FCD domain-containing protein [Roseinatronobacter sp. S2]WFE74935.1 FCD domain-containing protein [Roseinatronobacter sp. S2]
MSAPMPGFARNTQLSTRIAAHLLAQIEADGLTTGARLPTEAQLARDFGVSRAVIREAIAQLRNEGLVETRQGAGAFVADMAARPIRLDAPQDMDSRAFQHLFQLRAPLEVEAAALAARHRSAADMLRIKAALARFDQPEESADSSVAADLEFHRALALATGNPYFVQFLTAISDRIAHVILAARAETPLDALHAQTRREHAAICAAIVAGDAGAARAAMRAHLAGGAQRVGLQLDMSD